jgi:hypothetical protein
MSEAELGKKKQGNDGTEKMFTLASVLKVNSE